MGLTGSGKSNALRQYSGVPKSGARVVLFDPARDHSEGTHYYQSQSAFARALAEADASGRGYRVGYDGMVSPDIYEWWCRCCIAVLDSKRPLYMITEELAAASRGPGRAMTAHSWLMNQSRKYNGVYLCTTQFPARVSKDVYDNMGVVWFGRTSPRLQRQFVADFGLDPAQFAALQNLEFIRWSGGKTDLIRMQYQK